MNKKIEGSEPIPELGNRTWEELETVEDADSGHVLFKDQIRKRTPDGWKAIEVRVRVVRPLDVARARVECRELCQRLKLNPEADRDIFDELEQLCLLARAIRTPREPFAQFADPEELGNDYDEGSLQDVLGRINVYRHLLDPRDTAPTEQAMWEKAIAIARRRHLGPLTDMAGHAHPSFFIFMVDQALSSPRGRSFAQSFESLTPAPSPSKSSAESSAANPSSGSG